MLRVTRQLWTLAVLLAVAVQCIAKELPKSSSNGKRLVVRSDLLMVIPTTVSRLALVNTTRDFRRGIRTYVVINETQTKHLDTFTYREQYDYFPDDSKANKTWRGSQPGNTRWAFAPFMAHKRFQGSYKWMLLGDDNTVWYIPGVMKLLESFDPNLPYVITDNMWLKGKHPNTAAPRCLPCHFSASNIPRLAQARMGLVPQPACPLCTSEMACNEAKADISLRHKPASEAMQAAPEAPTFLDRDMRMAGRYRPPNRCGALAIGHGGSGLLISVGLMNYLHMDSTMEFIRSLRGCGGGDCLFARALIWYNHIGFTDPGVALSMGDINYMTHALFVDPSSQGSISQLLLQAGDLAHAKKPGCNETCRWVVENAVSHHVRVFKRLPIALSDLASEMTRAMDQYTEARAVLDRQQQLQREGQLHLT